MPLDGAADLARRALGLPTGAAHSGYAALRDTHVSLLAVVAALLVGAVGLALFWRQWSGRLAAGLRVEVNRRGGSAPTRKKREATAADTEAKVASNPFLAALELDSEQCAAEPFSQVRMCSLGDYYKSLDVPSGLSMERIMATLLDKAGMRVLLPALTKLEPSSMKQDFNLEDVAAQGFMGSLFRKLLSPLKIYAISSALNEASADLKELESSSPSIESFVAGEQLGVEPPFPPELDLPAVFIIERDVPAIMEAWGIKKDDVRQPLAPSPDLEYLPDLCTGLGGMTEVLSPWEAGVSRIMAKVFNRLAANSFPTKFLPADDAGSILSKAPRTFLVYISESHQASGGTAIDCPQELLASLHGDQEDPEGQKHEINMGIVSRVTSFGFGLSVKESPGEYTQVPLIFPLETGLELLQTSDPHAQQEKIIVPACHAGVSLKVDGPLLSFKLEWFQGIEGFTGWHSGNDTTMVWANDSEVEVQHNSPRWTLPEQWRAAAETTTVVAIALNVTSARTKLPNGGYGYLGICMDSAAAIQQALTGSTTLFPLILGGSVKARVILLYRELEAEFSASGKQELAEAAAALRLAMLELPTDIIHQPQATASICQRLLAMLPERSPFLLVKQCRSQVERLLEQVDFLKNDQAKPGKKIMLSRATSFKPGNK